jgi:hypothetical protein
MRRIGVDPESPHHILLSFLDETDQGLWIEFPRESAGMIAGAVVEAAKIAAERAGSDLPTLSASEQRLISEGMKGIGFTVSVSMDGHCAVLTVRTAAGLIFKFDSPWKYTTMRKPRKS